MEETPNQPLQSTEPMTQTQPNQQPPSQSSPQPPPPPPSTTQSQTTSSTQPNTQQPAKNILEAIEDFDSSIPDLVVHHFLNAAGMQTSDTRIIRLIAIAAQKFIHDIVSDSLQHCKLRGAQGKKAKEKKYTLTIEDLSTALAEYGIEVKRQQYFN